MKNLRIILGMCFYISGVGSLVLNYLSSVKHNPWIEGLITLGGFFFLWLSFEYFTPRARDDY